jgi:O-antigen ligase
LSSLPVAFDVQATEKRSTGAKLLAIAPWLLIAASPPLFAVLTWNGAGQSDAVMASIRLFGFPVVFVELCVIAIAWVRGWKPLRQLRFLSPFAPLLLGLLILVAFYSALRSAPRPAGALIWTYLSLTHVMFGLSAAHLLSKMSVVERSWIWPAVVIGIVAYAFMLWLFVNKSHAPDFDWQYLGFAVSNVRQLGYYAAIGGIAALACAAQSKGWASVVFGMAASLILAVLFWSGSRGGLVAVAAALLLGAIFISEFRTLRAFGVVILVGIISAAVSRMQPTPDPVFGLDRIVRSSHLQPGTDLSSGRLQMWDDAWKAFIQRPLFGYGEGQFGFIVPEPFGVFLHPHNILLQLLFQWGVFGTLICLVLLVMLVRRCRSSVRLDPSLTHPAAMVATVLIIFSMFDGALFHTYPLMMFSLAVAMIAATQSPSSPPEASGTPGRG